GTRVIRFVIQELLHDAAARRAARNGNGHETHPRIPVWLTSALAVAGWGFILRWGIVDQQGGTQALFKMFGIANQLLAVLALPWAPLIMLKPPRRFVWVTGLPLLVLGAFTLTAAFQAIFSPNPKIGALAATGVASATPVAVQNAYLTALLTG